MRRVALIAAIAVCTPWVQGEPNPDDFVILAGDAVGDVAHPGGAPLEAPAADLVELGLAETAERLWFRLVVQDLQPPNDDPASGNVDLQLFFSSEHQAYRVLIDRNVPVSTGAPVYEVRVFVHEEATGHDRELDINASLDVQVEQNVILVGLPWTGVPDEQGLRLLPGGALRGIYAFTSSGNNLDGLVLEGIGAPGGSVLDRAPDDGEVLHIVRDLGAKEGLLVGKSQNPLRASNGAPTTFLFPLSISNLGDEDAIVEVVPRGLPDGWSAEPLSNPVVVDARSTTTSSIVVATTSRHQHGGQDVFYADLLLQGEVVSSVQYEVHYTAIAQPSGHHPELQFLSRLARTESALDPALDVYSQVSGYHRNRAYMTTSLEEARDDEVPVTPETVDGQERWRIALTPTLGLGLDFNGGQGVVKMPLQPSRDSTLESVTLDAELAIELGDETQILATGSAEVASLEGLEIIELPLVVADGVEVVPYQRGQNLVLTVYTTYVDPLGIGTTPNLHPGGSSVLPLDEYQDPIPEGSLSPIELTAKEQLQPVNPGKRAAFELLLEGPTGEQATLDVLGLPEGWSSLFSLRTLEVGEALALQVTAPGDAEHGDAAVFFVRGTPREGAPTAVGLQAYVTTSEDIAEPPPLEPGGVDSPPASAVWIMAVVAWAGRAAFASRRR